jgi:hypothetical protein
MYESKGVFEVIFLVFVRVRCSGKDCRTLRVKRQWLMLISRHYGIILLFFKACCSIIATYLCPGLFETPRKMLFVVSKLYH